MTGNYFGSMKLGKQLAEKAKEVALEKEEAEARMAELEKRIALAHNLGLQTEKANGSLDRARELYEKRDYKECISTSSVSTDRLVDEIEQMFSSRIKSTESMMRFLASRGSKTDALQSALQNVQSLLGSGKFEDAESSLSSIWQKEEKSLAELFSNEFSSVQKAMMDAKLYCGEIDGVEKALSDARSEITANNIENAFRLLEQAGSLITREMKIKSDEGLKQLSLKIEISKQFGLGVGSYRERLERIRSFSPEQKFGEIQRVLDSLNTEIDRKLRRGFEIRLKTVRNDIQDSTLSPSFASRAGSALNEIEVQVQRGEFDKAFSALGTLDADLEKAKYDYIARILFNGKKYIAMALKNGLDLAPVNKHLNDVREQMKNRRYREAIASAEKANSEAIRLSTMTADADQTMRKLEAEFQALVTIVSNSVDISIRFTEVKKKYESKDIEGFLADSGKLLADIDVLLENFATGQIDALDRILGALEHLGAETLDFNRRMGAAVSFVKNNEFSRSLSITSELEKETESRVKELSKSWSARARESIDGTSGALRERLEKMMQTSIQLASKGENYRSASVAKDIVDWAAKGDVYRVRSLIERSKSLLNVVPDVSSSSAVNMLDAAERNAEMDTDSALNTAGEAHDILFNLLNDYFVKEMASLMDMVSTCRRKRVEIGYGYTLIGRARAALKFEDFEAASRMVSVARTEIQKRLKQVEDIEADLVRAESMLADARKGGSDAEEVQGLLQEARAALKRYDYVEARTGISRAIMLEEKGMAANLAAKEIIQFKAVLAVADSLKMPMKELEARKEEVLKLMRERKHYEALTSVRTISKELNASVMNNLSEQINSVASDSAKAELDGLDNSVIESRLEKARGFLSASQFSQCLKSLNLASDELELVKNSVNEAISIIEKTDSVVLKLDELNMLDNGTLNLLKQAKNLLKNDQHMLAFQTAQKCMEACGERVSFKGSQLLERLSHSIYSVVGGDEHDSATAQINEAAAALSGETAAAVDALITLKDLSERLALQTEMAGRTAEVLRKRAEELAETGIASGELNSKVAEVEALLNAKNYRSVIEKGIEVEQLVEELSSSSEKAKEKVGDLEDKLARYEDMGLGIEECKSTAQEALDLISSGKIGQGMRKIQECESSADKILHKACLSKIAALESARSVAKRFDVQVKEDEESLSDMIAAGDIAAAFIIGSRNYDEVAPIVTSKLRSRFEEAIGVEALSQSFTKVMRHEFEELISSQRFEEAADFVIKTEQDMASKSTLLVEVGNLSQQFTGVASDLRKTGINVRAFDLRFKNYTSEISDDNLSALRKLVQEMKKMRSDYSPRLWMECHPSKWGPQVRVTNNGRVVALDSSISINGASISKVEKLGSLKPGESRTINLPSTLSGEVVVSSRTRNPVDDSELSTSSTFIIEGNAIHMMLHCSYCKGKIREGTSTYGCNCGRFYHPQCAKRAAVCECGQETSKN